MSAVSAVRAALCFALAGANAGVAMLPGNFVAPFDVAVAVFAFGVGILIAVHGGASP